MNATLATVLTSAIDPRWWVTSKGTLCRIINFKNKYNYLLKAPCYLKSWWGATIWEFPLSCEYAIGENMWRPPCPFCKCCRLWSPFLLSWPCTEGSNLQSEYSLNDYNWNFRKNETFFLILNGSKGRSKRANYSWAMMEILNHIGHLLCFIACVFRDLSEE